MTVSRKTGSVCQPARNFQESSEQPETIGQLVHRLRNGDQQAAVELVQQYDTVRKRLDRAVRRLSEDLDL